MIEKKSEINLNGLSVQDQNIIASMENESIRGHLKGFHNKSFKRYRDRYKSLLNEQGTNENEKTEQKIKDKIELLINT